MMDRQLTIWYTPVSKDGEEQGDEVVVIARIVRLSKDWEKDITYIHLDTGEVLGSSNSMKTLKARIDLAKPTP